MPQRSMLDIQMGVLLFALPRIRMVRHQDSRLHDGTIGHHKATRWKQSSTRIVRFESRFFLKVRLAITIRESKTRRWTRSELARNWPDDFRFLTRRPDVLSYSGRRSSFRHVDHFHKERSRWHWYNPRRLSTLCAGKGVTVAVPKFKVGDRVERVEWLVPEYMRKGIVTGVIPNKQNQDSFNEYAVNFDNQLIMILYETQLRLAPTDPHWSRT